MTFITLGFITGLSLILAIGAQNIFVIEQGIKKQFIFFVCLICSISDLLLIFLGIFLFEYFQTYFNNQIEIILNILLIIFLLYFIYTKLREQVKNINLNTNIRTTSIKTVIFKTLGFTYLNPHVYSDTVFFLGNFSKNFFFIDKIYFGIGASISSFLFFFILGYASNYFSKFLNNEKIWKLINSFIILFMSGIIFYIIIDLFN
tara:strand:+ start:4141 stop:4749 length:609 start_codon:yes stop_codon:yes gene_type:complete